MKKRKIKKYKKPNRSEYESDPLKKSSVILNVENSYKEDYQEEPEIETNLSASTNFEESSNNQPKESLPIIPPFELPKKKIRSRKKKKKHKN